MQLLLLLFSVVLILVSDFLTGKLLAITDYCSSDLGCYENTHIACNNSGDWAKICMNPYIANMTSARKYLILKNHNEQRNNISGGATNLPSATKMPTLFWNDELAELAELNVKQCRMQHDGCRNTYLYQYAGQNLAIYGTSEPTIDIEKILTNSIQVWVNEIQYMTENEVNSFPKDFPKPIGHATQVLQQNARRLGCAISIFNAPRTSTTMWTVFLFACNYSYGNILNDPVYEIGSPAEKCTSKSSLYPSLCS